MDAPQSRFERGDCYRSSNYSISRKTKMAASREERLSCAVVELRQSVWSEVLHIAQCWKVDPQDLMNATRMG